MFSQDFIVLTQLGENLKIILVKKLLARYRELPIKTRQLLRIGIIFALVAALPLFVWAILTQRFDIREKASTGEIPPPTPVVTSFPTPTPPGTTGECQVCSGFAGLMCVSGLICQEEDMGGTDGLDGPIPDLGGICVKPDGSSNCDASPSPTPSTPPQPKPLDFRIKFGGVSDGSADGAKATIRFLNSSGNYITSPVEFSHIGDGVYQAIIMPTFAHLLTSSNTGIGDYTFYVKGEKHAANKFCTYSQDGPCQGAGSLVIPYETAIPMPFYDFTGYALEPGDLPPQDGKVDSADFGKVTSLMGKLCSELTEEEKHTADLDYNGCVNIRDAFLIRKTLETRYDEY